ncbi:MAG: hypothetical protein WBD47_05160 [Phormidesmis sp.]
MVHQYGAVSFLGLTSWLLLSVMPTALALPEIQGDYIVQTTESLPSHLPDGSYQLCSEPVPIDWKDGAGVCLNIIKQGTTVDGYYGYPHSERFVCIHGQISHNHIHGGGFVFSWPGHPWSEIPQEPFLWDEEGRLTLAGGTLTRQEGDLSWITFQQADLNIEGMLLYPHPRMNPPDQTCNWRSSSSV